MSAQEQVACLGVPYFGVTVARRADRGLGERPLVLLDESGRVLAADARATAAGVRLGSPERQALARCPEAIGVPAARYPLLEAQAALDEEVKRYTDRWQPAGLGHLYLVPPIAAARAVRAARDDRDRGAAREAPAPGLAARELLGWCQGLAAAVRALGWEPALGVTGSKFGAEVAGQVAGANTALLVAPEAQRDFLAARPVEALPLEPDALAQLRYLGINTLGQFVRLPAAGVVARFGPAGRTAQRWAQGLDERSVIPPWEAPEVSARIEFDGPLADRQRLLAALERQAGRLLAPLQEQRQAPARLSLLVGRADGRTVPASHVFPMPTAALDAVRLALAAALDRVAWDGEPASEVTLTLAGITDAPGQQLALFDFNLDSRARLAATLRRLSTRFGPETFRLATLADPQNPLPERRATWRRFDP